VSVVPTSPDEPAGTSHIDWPYEPREYSTGSDLGAVTGGQAAVYAPVEAACTQLLAALDRLTSLGAASVVPHDAIEASARQVLAELRAPGGPRPGDVERHLHQLRDSLSQAAETVNTVDEEQVRIAFVTLNDYCAELARSWSQHSGRRPLS
jgi:hypothetical protein